ncbi:MAG TPA: hypothetical protein VF610_09280 [Segetibacter sp.]
MINGTSIAFAYCQILLNMQRFLIVGFLLLSVVLSCRQLQEKLLPAFNVNIPAIKLTVPPLPIVSDKEIPVGALKTPINMDSTIKANTAGTFGAVSVHIVRVKKLVILATNADPANNLSNFETARMAIFSDTASIDIATIQFPETFADSITIVPAASPDITKYLKGSNLAYNLYWKNRKKTNKFLKLEVRITLSVQ